jgi:hypothetical protein
MSGTLVNGAFFGRVAAPRTIGGVALAETSYGAGFVVPVHTHDSPMFCLALTGTFTEEVERSATRVGPRGVFFQPAGVAHAESFHSPASRLFNIQLGAAWLQRLGPYDVRLPAAPAAVRSGRLSLLAAQLHAEYCMGSAAERLSVDGLLLSMLAELTRAAARRERARPAYPRHRARGHPRAAARSLGLAAARRARERAPVAPGRSVPRPHRLQSRRVRARARIERARAALTETNLPIARIAPTAASPTRAISRGCSARTWARRRRPTGAHAR